MGDHQYIDVRAGWRVSKTTTAQLASWRVRSFDVDGLLLANASASGLDTML